MSGDARVVVVTGLGGMGIAIARRIGSGGSLLLADIDAAALRAAAEDLRADGYQVAEQVTDVADAAAIDALAMAAGELGRVEVLVHTAGLSPVQATVEGILRVDLLGTALLLDAFGAAIAAGGSGVVIASMAGTMSFLDADFERRLASTPAGELLALPEIVAVDNPGAAYGIAKRGNQVRVRAAALAWGRRGARINSISPGIISTPMGVAELDGPSGEFMRAMIAGSATGRIGTPQDIAAAVDFLTGPHSTFVTGTDLLVDGGVVASLQSGG
jgi:NAD(P)-dependent dehydrogenase (short-subunit alcohol dehydrogenase family)